MSADKAARAAAAKLGNHDTVNRLDGLTPAERERFNAIMGDKPAVVLQAEIDEFVDARGYYAGALLPDGRVAMLVPRLFGADIVIGAEPTEMAGVQELYTFAPSRVGIAAWFHWSRGGFEGEPEGWVRHRPSDRRRYPDGDPATERIMP